MLMVVFGAGASYDSVPSRPPDAFPTSAMPDRPPLANQLFDDRPRFVQAVSSFSRCQPIVPFLRHIATGDSLERVLESLQAQGDEYPERYRQLAAVRFYLHVMLWGCEVGWKEEAKGVTNYKTLLDEIERWRPAEQPVCLVTFNYDTLLEAALPTVGVEIQEISDYIASDYKVIKLHGSVNWAREVDTPIENLNDINTWQVAYELIDRAPDLEITERYCIVTEYPIGKLDRSAAFPAVAIPVETKSDYECPSGHLETLRAFIPEMTKLLVVGWRGAEASFLKLLAANLKHDLRVMVVSGGADQADEPIKRLQAAGIKGEFATAPGGFTGFIVRREVDEFLRAQGSTMT